MSKVEFLIVFVSIILGFNISEYLKGLGIMIKHRRELKRYVPLAMWQLLILVLVIQWWWAFWLYSDHVQENMGYFLLMISIPMIYFMSIEFLFPSESDIRQYKGSLKNFFHANSKYFYFTVALLFSIYSLTGLIFLNEELLSIKIILRGLTILICLFGSYKRNPQTDILAIGTTVCVLLYFIWIRF